MTFVRGTSRVVLQGARMLVCGSLWNVGGRVWSFFSPSLCFDISFCGDFEGRPRRSLENMNVNIDCFLFSEMKLSYSMSLKCYNRRRHCIVGELSLWKLQNNFEIFPLTILTRSVVSDAT